MVEQGVIDFVTNALSVLTIVGGILVVWFLLELVFLRSRGKKYSKFWSFVKEDFLLLSFIVALLATGGSLFYSELAGYNPCKLCWYQRIFMYPSVLLYGFALHGKDRHIGAYGFVLSIIGALIAGYHYLAQLGVAETSCDVVGYSASCSEYFVLHFGYVTIPMMAVTAFLLIAVFSWIGLKGKA